MKRTLIAIITVLGFVTVLGNACDNVKLSIVPTIKAADVAVNPLCTSAPSQGNAPIKVLFLVDMSGSNCTQQGLPPACDSSGTDPNKSYRLGLMQSFITTHISQTNMSYGFIALSGTTAAALNGNGTGSTATFSNDINQLTNALTLFQAAPDSGATPYKAAMTMANQSIQNDVSSSATKSSYFIVIISDGQPTDYGYPPNQAEIDADVKTLITIGGQATLSAIYYNPLNVTGDISVLQGMASTGGGGFSNTNVQGKNVPLEQIISLTNSYPYVITQMMVVNLNSAPCDDGTMGADSDADGICDKDEIRYNTTLKADSVTATRMGTGSFDPQNRNSFNPAYGDLFYYRHILYGQMLDNACALTGIQSIDDADYDLVNTCEEAFITSSTANGPTPLWTSAMGTVADPFNFDSDGDGFTDWMEFNFGRSQSGPMEYVSAQTNDQGYTMAQVLSQHRNPLSPGQATPYDGVLQFGMTNDKGQNCYSFTQNTLPLYQTLPVTQSQVSNYPQLVHGRNENVIMIYFIEKPENALSGPGHLRYFFQILNANVANFELNLDSSQYGLYAPVNSLVSLALNPASPTPTPSPSPSLTPTPSPTP